MARILWLYLCIVLLSTCVRTDTVIEESTCTKDTCQPQVNQEQKDEKSKAENTPKDEGGKGNGPKESVTIMEITDSTEPVFLGDFHIPTEPVPRLSFRDPIARQRMNNSLPVILTDTELFTTEEPWSFENMAKTFSESEWRWQVFNAPTRRFLYFGNDRNYANYKWSVPYTTRFLLFSEFVDQYREIKKAKNSSRIYMQTGLYEGSTKAKFTLNKTLLEEIGNVSRRFASGGSHWFYVGMPDVYTDMHYDYNDHVVAQIYGHKRWTLLNPDQYGNMYPYPMASPFDRNSRVDMTNPDYSRYPKFRNVRGHEAILRPGDVLYVPAFWWHLVESEHHSETVSLSMDQHSHETEFINLFDQHYSENFKEHKDGSVTYRDRQEFEAYMQYLFRIFEKKENDIVYFPRPDNAARQVHVRRVVERMITESIGSHRVADVLRELYEGRFDGLEYNDEK